MIFKCSTCYQLKFLYYTSLQFISYSVAIGSIHFAHAVATFRLPNSDEYLVVAKFQNFEFMRQSDDLDAVSTDGIHNEAQRRV